MDDVDVGDPLRSLLILPRFFASFSVSDFARSGSTATITIEFPVGPIKRHELSEDDVALPPSALNMLHSLGMKEAFLNKGIIELRQPFTVCTLGKVMTPEQCRILV